MAAVSVKGAVLVLVLTAVAYIGSLFFLPPVFFLLPFFPALYRRLNDLSTLLWLGLVPALLGEFNCYLAIDPFRYDVVFGVKIKIAGDLRPIKGPCLIIMNHRTRFDWLFLWCYMIRLGDLCKHKIILKSSLKKIPGFGWAMQAALFLFLSRKWASDEKYISESLAYFRSYPLQLLIFPEGTDLSDSNKLKSHQYAEKNGLPKYEYVLHTRTKGFVHCLQEMRKGGVAVPVINLSIAYVGPMPQNERDMLGGNWPQEIHFHAKQVPPTELPGDEGGLEEWIKQQWDEKEKQLEHFYANSKFTGPYMSDEGLNQPRQQMISILVFWVVFFLVHIYGLYYYSFVCWYYILTSVFFIAVNMFTSGTDQMVLKVHQWNHSTL